MRKGQRGISGFLVDVETGERLEFPINPNDLSDEKSTVYATVRVPGLSHPRYQFVAGDPRKLAFKLHFFRGPVKEQVAWLRALLYPEHGGTLLRNAPHRVLLFFGDLYPGVLCIVRQVKIRYHSLFGRKDLLPQRAEVDLQLEEIVAHSIDAREVRS